MTQSGDVAVHGIPCLYRRSTESEASSKLSIIYKGAKKNKIFLVRKKIKSEPYVGSVNIADRPPP